MNNGSSPVVLDAFGRPLRSLRLSVTDRCNLRCQYCMPEEEYKWIARSEILSFEELTTLAGVFIGLGVEKLRLTGGEPLLRRDLAQLVAMLNTSLRPQGNASHENGASTAPLSSGLRDLALTTNGLLLAAQARDLHQAGLDRVTVSLDTLRPDRFRALAKYGAVEDVLAGIRAARDVGFEELKINTVVIRGFNDDELADMIEFGRSVGAEVRFIEYMDVGGATHWSASQVVSRAEILDRLRERFGPIEPLNLETQGAAPADRFRFGEGTTFGIISSTTAPFCALCDRARLTPDGLFLLCLYAHHGLDLKHPLRAGASPGELRALITERWQGRRDRGAEERKTLRARGPLFQIEDLRRDVHLEMHTRGG
jgi:cyclic pyranopterin phosphate synthase